MIDLAPLLTQVIVPIATPAVAAAATWAFAAVAGHFHIKIQDSQRALVNEVINRGIAYAASKAPQSLNVTTGSPVTDLAVGYAVSHAPGALRSLGVTPDGLRQMVEARLPGAGSTVELTVPPY